MRNVERIIWFGCIFFMIVIIILTNLQKVETKQSPTITPVNSISIAPVKEIANLRISVKGVSGYSSATEFSFDDDVGNDRGTDAGDGISSGSLTIFKNTANLALEIKLGERGETTQEFITEADGEIFQGPGEWRYYLEKSWDPSPTTKVYDNVRRVFFLERDGVLVKAYQYDYTGGKYDEEIERILSGVEFY